MKRRAFTLVELLVVMAIIGVLVSMMVPALTAARHQARTAVCLANVRGFGYAFSVYAAEHEDKIIQLHFPAEGLIWADTCLDYYGSADILLCPEASEILPGPGGQHHNIGRKRNGRPLKAWWIEKESGHKFVSSYGTNGWVHDGKAQDPMSRFLLDADLHWGKMGLGRPSEIPLVLDCTWFSGYPFATDIPLEPNPLDAYHYWYDYHTYIRGMMNRHCFPRHGGGINGVFMDGSARGIELPELWMLIWHRDYHPRILYEYMQPDWMRDL